MEPPPNTPPRSGDVSPPPVLSVAVPSPSPVNTNSPSDVKGSSPSPATTRSSSTSSPGGAQRSPTSGSGQRHSTESRSATFSGNANIGISTATLWRNKAVSCEAIRSFEAARKSQIDVFQEKDRVYWQFFEKEILRARDENARLQRFFALRLQADLAYAESLKKIRQVIERPVATLPTAPNGSPPPSNGGSSPSAMEQLSVASSCVKALNTLGEVQQQLSEKIVQFTNVIKRDVVARPLDEMVATFEERSSTMLADGNRLDAMLHTAQKSVLDSFIKYDAIYREMESERHSNISMDAKRDLWLAEIAYCINVQKLRQVRVEYVKGMSALFQQYKTLEVLRVSVIQTAVDTYIRKQKITYDELSGAMSEPFAAAQRIDPDRDLVNSIRRIPKNFTAAALATENTDQKLFSTLRSPISSPLLVRCGFLKHQVTGSIFKSWKDVLCAITQDEFLHLIDLKETANRSIAQSSEAMLEAICTNEQTTDVVCTSIHLPNCRINMIGKSAIPTFEITEMSQATGLFSSMFRVDTSRKFTFQCSSQTDLIDWVVAAKRFVTAGVTTSVQ
ncbi:hypothetical protein Poli38472_001724 [Pythium oligandrum]|uniref:PH domain-containing protein n=1 Tax=Pythium oligandrum TaxID=41045 RepID=A0A8K1FTG5_PYTOL|nr:hypothetical protein Poli38472_001724 [Pythium oligandrum]|eukprot:TMW69568.1 hypothetical protein Poli38472_001724 [Pythium oligandrum]